MGLQANFFVWFCINILSNIYVETLEMPLINCKIDSILTWSATGETKFTITDKKLYAPVVTVSIQDNAKLLEQLKSGVKKAIDWNKCLWKNLVRKKKPILKLLNSSQLIR